MMERLRSAQELEQLRTDLVATRSPDRPCISICAGAGCLATGAQAVIDAFAAELDRQGLKADVDGAAVPDGTIVVALGEDGEIVASAAVQDSIFHKLVWMPYGLNEITIKSSAGMLGDPEADLVV